MKESVIERYLHHEVTKAGGTTRKFKGRKNDPDRIVIWPAQPCRMTGVNIHFIECKRPEGKARPGQLREHKRLQKLGCFVGVIDTKEQVDYYVKACRP